MPVFLAFLAGSIFTVAISKSVKSNMKTTKEDFDEILNDKENLKEKVEEILRKKGI